MRSRTRKIVFLDRDGVINRFPGHGEYVTSLDSFRLLPRSAGAIAALTRAGYEVYVISNQAGVAKGLYSKKELARITERMLRKVESRGGRINGVYYCLHLPDASCSCRKPGIGLIEKAAWEHKFRRQDIKNAYFIGDSIRDVKTGKKAGCRTILVFSGSERKSNRLSWEVEPDITCQSLDQAVRLILDK